MLPVDVLFLKPKGQSRNLNVNGFNTHYILQCKILHAYDYAFMMLSIKF